MCYFWQIILAIFVCSMLYVWRVVRRLNCTRTIATVANIHEKSVGSQMQAWQIHSYGEFDELKLSKSARVPQIINPDDVMVEVHATSVNPIDISMLGGYGSGLLGAIRQMSSGSLSRPIEFPLTLGRDFAGKIIGKGHGVSSDLDLGVEVWGAVQPYRQGAHAEIVVTSESLVHRKPRNLSMVEASAIPYAAMTAWVALNITGDLCLLPARGKNVLVLGGSGGVGSLAIQLLRAWGSQVVATCSADAKRLVESLGAHCVIDYAQPDADKIIRKEGKYDIILDAAGLGADEGRKYADCLKDWNMSKFVTLRSPMLRNVDNYGVVLGMAKNAVDLLVSNMQMMAGSMSSTVRWAFFMPIPGALQELTKLVEEGKLIPLVDKVFKFEDLPAAYEQVKRGHLRGKVMVTLKEEVEHTAREQAEHGQ